MPNRPRLSTFPLDVLRQLDARLLESQFSRFAEHAAWLAEVGHPVGRSAINYYAMQHRARIEAGLPAAVGSLPADKIKFADQRIECLKVVAALPLCDLNVLGDDLKAAAADLHRWAYEGAAP